MFTTHVALSNRRLTRLLLSGAFGLSLWAIISASPTVSGNFDGAASRATECQDTADVMAALDRSRNGISLTCNSDTLTWSNAR